MFLIGWLFCITFNENFWFCKKCFLTFSELNQRGGLSTSDTQKTKNIPKVYGIKFSKKGQKRHVCDSCVFSIFSSISCGWTGLANLLLSCSDQLTFALFFASLILGNKNETFLDIFGFPDFSEQLLIFQIF